MTNTSKKTSTAANGVVSALVAAIPTSPENPASGARNVSPKRKSEKLRAFATLPDTVLKVEKNTESNFFTEALNAERLIRKSRQERAQFIDHEFRRIVSALHHAMNPHVEAISQLKVIGIHNAATDIPVQHHRILQHHGIRLPIVGGFISVTVKQRPPIPAAKDQFTAILDEYSGYTEGKCTAPTSPVEPTHGDSAGIIIEEIIENRKNHIHEWTNFTSRDSVTFVPLLAPVSKADALKKSLIPVMVTPESVLEIALCAFFKHVHSISI